jgi:hypothetical protein
MPTLENLSLLCLEDFSVCSKHRSPWYKPRCHLCYPFVKTYETEFRSALVWCAYHIKHDLKTWAEVDEWRVDGSVVWRNRAAEVATLTLHLPDPQPFESRADCLRCDATGLLVSDECCDLPTWNYHDVPAEGHAMGLYLEMLMLARPKDWWMWLCDRMPLPVYGQQGYCWVDEEGGESMTWSQYEGRTITRTKTVIYNNGKYWCEGEMPFLPKVDFEDMDYYAQIS